MKAFPNPYFNAQWQFRATRLFKKKNNKTIRDIINFKNLSRKLGNDLDIWSLIYLYRYRPRNILEINNK